MPAPTKVSTLSATSARNSAERTLERSGSNSPMINTAKAATRKSVVVTREQHTPVWSGSTLLRPG